MNENEIRLIRDLYNHYDQKQDINDEFLKSLTENYGTIRGIIMNVILKYDSEAEITDEYLDAKLNQYNIDLKSNTIQDDAKESKEDSPLINIKPQEKTIVADDSTKKTKKRRLLPIIIIASIAIILSLVIFYLNSTKPSEKSLNNDITNENSFTPFNIKIKDGKKYLNIRKSPINGSVVGKVSEKENYTVSQEYKSNNPLCLLNKKMILKDVKSGEEVEKPKSFKLNNVVSIDEYTYKAEVINLDKTTNKVYIQKSDVDLSFNKWYYLNEVNGWIYSEFCEKLN